MARSLLRRSSISSWKRSMSGRRGPELGQYSAYLARYQRADAGAQGRLAAIELPGQYAGDRPPQPSTHVTIECLSSQLRVMESLRVPKRLVVHGSPCRSC